MTARASWYFVSQEHKFSIVKVPNAYSSWLTNNKRSQPQRPEDIQFTRLSPGRQIYYSAPAASLIVKIIKYSANNYTPVRRGGVQQRIPTYVEMLGEAERNLTSLGDHEPSDNCINSLIDQHGLKEMTV